MKESYSIKTQLILILLIPISGLIYMTVTNINSFLQDYKSIEEGLEKINNIAKLSRGISEISIERDFYNYSSYDLSKKTRFSIEKQITIDWFSNTHINDPVITKNLKTLYNSLLELQSNIENGKETATSGYNKYAQLNRSLNNLIEREIINCEYLELTKLANNYYNYVILKEASLLRRGVVLQKTVENLKHRELDKTLLELYFNTKTNEDFVNFNLVNNRFDDVNKDLIQFKNSSVAQSFYSNSEAIIEWKLQYDPGIWWDKSEKITEKFTELEKNNLGYIVDYANNEKQTALRSIVISSTILFLFLLTAFYFIFRLIKRLSLSLSIIATSIKKISLGEMIEDQDISGNTEFIQISNSFNDLLAAKREHIDLALKISSGNLGSTIRIRSDKDILNKSLNSMSLELSRLSEESKEVSLMEKNIIEVNKSIVESKKLDDFGSNVCQTIVRQTDGCQANFYVINPTENENELRKIGGYAEDKNSPVIITVGEGLVGEVAKMGTQRCLNNLPENYAFVSSSLGKSPYYNVLITPVSYKKQVIGVIEIGSFDNFTDTHKKLLNTVSGTIGSAVEVFIRNEELRRSVEEINRKNNILQAQEEELRGNNEELNRQTLLLQQSEEELRNQAAELEQTNAYLEDQRRELELKNQEIVFKNDELLVAQQELRGRAEEVEQASKYKSEFLANMSHELRTPLNSILILSDLLKENTAGNLSQQQIDNLAVINNSGKDLLTLITDILDISKIEAGKVEVHPEEFTIDRVSSDMQAVFSAQMQKKDIEFISVIAEDCPKNIYTDIGKLEQIVKNYLSNALKFTPESGKVTLRFESGQGKNDYKTLSLAKLSPNEILSIHVEDNGIGISEENKTKLFQSFQQADSSTSRKYGGTGLGLYISKEIAQILGGEADFQSELNKGSIFSIYIPITFKTDGSRQNVTISTPEQKKQSEEEVIKHLSGVPVDLSANLNGNRVEVNQDDKTLLIIEDDEAFSDILQQVAHENGFKTIIAPQGEIGLQYAKEYKPKAIILDLKLPGIDGWTVLKWLKEDAGLKHIPVHVMSGMDREKLVKEMGAFDFQIKPLTAERLKDVFTSIDTQINKVFKRILILEDDINLNYSIKELVHDTDKNAICIQAHTYSEAEDILKNEEIDCAIMDISLHDSADIKNIATLKKVSKNSDISIIVNTGKPLTEEEVLELQESTSGIVIKTENATDRLKDEIMLFINKVESENLKDYSHKNDLLGGEVLKDKTILVVDDDIRNIYALSSALSSKGATILTALNGKEALEMLENNPKVDLVLMDVMMPEMDGFEATRRIRQNYKWKNLPVIALTAKAMKGDREEILNAGASDYQSKPIDIQKLISLISIWVYN
ncbi:MAG: response regulator [Flavobacterium sp.]